MKIKPSTFPPQIPWGFLSSWLQVAGRQPQQAGLPRGMMVRVSVHTERLLVSPRRLIGIQGSATALLQQPHPSPWDIRTRMELCSEMGVHGGTKYLVCIPSCSSLPS